MILLVYTDMVISLMYWISVLDLRAMHLKIEAEMWGRDSELKEKSDSTWKIVLRHVP